MLESQYSFVTTTAATFHINDNMHKENKKNELND